MKINFMNINLMQIVRGLLISLVISSAVKGAESDNGNLSEKENSKHEQNYTISVTLGLKGPIAEDRKIHQVVVVYPDKSEQKVDISDKKQLTGRFNLKSIKTSDLLQGNFEMYYLSTYDTTKHVHQVACQFSSPLDKMNKISKLRLHAETKFEQNEIQKSCNIEIQY